MKITAIHFSQLENLINNQIDKLSGQLSEYFSRYQRNTGDWQKRFRWDLLYSIPYLERAAWFDEVYKYANDDHIDTALRKITKEYFDA